MSSFDDVINALIEERLNSKLEEFRKSLESKSDSSNEDWIRPGKVCRMLGIDPAHLNKLVDCGLLTPCFLPGTTRGDRRFILREVLELKEKNTLNRN